MSVENKRKWRIEREKGTDERGKGGREERVRDKLGDRTEQRAGIERLA